MLNNRYRLVAQQGSGGMAVIYKAVDQTLGRTVAVKVLRPSLITDPTFLERFRNEARHIARLSHPNIVTVHDFQQDGNTYYIVMEFVEGQDLKRLIRTQAPFSVERALNIAIQICAGIGYAHRSGVVHADVKPQNILVKADDMVKVTDFGIALALSDASIAQRQKVVWGSPHYFSPEQAQGERPTPASDVYSLGVVIFEMLTGRLPFIGTDQQELALAHIRDAPPSASDFNPAVPSQLEKIIQKVMSKEPSARYRTAEQLERILRSYQQQGHDVTGSLNAPVRQPSGNIYGSQTVPSASGSPPTQPAQAAVPPMYAQGMQGTPPPPPAQVFAQQGTPMPYYPPEYTQPDYLLNEDVPGTIDAVTIALGFIALVAVAGLILLWLEVFRLYGA